MPESKLRTQSMDFAVQIINLSAEAVLPSAQISARHSMHMAKQIL